MKCVQTILIFLLICSWNASVVLGQNSVNIKQKGRGNKVSVNQSKAAVTAHKKHKQDNCNDFYRTGSNKQNTIIIKDANSQKTYKTSKRNRNSFFLNQAGTNRLSFIQLWGLTDTVAATQKGAQNSISLYVANKDSANQKWPDYIHLRQNGRKNEINVGPCNDSKPNIPKSNSRIRVEQNGEKNSVSIKE